MKDLLYTEAHMWIQVNGSEATIGLTEHGQKDLGDVVFVDIPKEGAELVKGEECGAMESVKTVESMFSPLSGVVVGSNVQLLETPELVNSSPQGDGWFFTIKMNDTSELSEYMNESGYRQFCG
jgi:glycine cleavage system H protein